MKISARIRVGTGAAVLATACVASAVVGASPAGAADASAPSPGHVAATVPLPSGSSQVQTSAAGDEAVVLTNDGRRKTLTTYRLGRSSITRVGATSWVLGHPGTEVLRVSPDGRTAYVFDDDELLAFTLTGTAPRRVDRLGAGAVAVYSGPIADVVVAPNGRHVYVMSRYGVQTVDSRRPSHLVPGEETRVDTALPGDDSGMITTTGLATADGHHLVLGGFTYDPDLEDGDGGYSQIAVCDLAPGTSKATVVRRGNVTVEGDIGTYPYTHVAKLAASDDAGEVYAGVVAERGRGEIAIARVRLSDFGVTDQLASNGRYQQRLTPTRTGSRLYFTEGVRRGSPARTEAQQVRWTAPGLGTRHAVIAVGPVMDFAVSQGGPTHGMLFVASSRSGHPRLSAVRMS